VTRYSIFTSISHVCLIPCVYCCVSMCVHVRTFLYHLLMINTSQGVTADLPQLSINDSHHLLMLEGLSKVVHDTTACYTHVTCCVSMHVHHKDVPMSSINLYPSRDVTPNLPWPSVMIATSCVCPEACPRHVITP